MGPVVRAALTWLVWGLLGEEMIYRAPGREPIEIRCRIRRNIATRGVGGEILARHSAISLLRSEVANPRHGDLIILGEEIFRVEGIDERGRNDDWVATVRVD